MAHFVEEHGADAQRGKLTVAEHQIGEDGLPDLGFIKSGSGDGVKDKATESVEDRAPAVDFQAVELGYAVGNKDGAAGVETGAGEGFFPIGG